MCDMLYCSMFAILSDFNAVNSCQSKSSLEYLIFSPALQWHVSGFIETSILRTVAELEIADFLNAGPLPLDAIAEKAEVDSSNLVRVMRAAESIGVFAERRYNEVAPVNVVTIRIAHPSRALLLRPLDAIIPSQHF